MKGGIYVIDPESGKLLGFIAVPRDEVTNCAFGGDDLKTLYITGGGTLYSIRVATPGRGALSREVTYRCRCDRFELIQHS